MQYTDGTPITDLAGFRVRYGISTSTLNETLQVPMPTASSVEIDNLASTTWYFTVTAYTSSGQESEESVAAVKTFR